MEPRPRDIRLLKPTGRAEQKRERLAAKLKAWVALVRYVKARDQHRCRVCGQRATLDAHHIVFKSAGGQDSKSNVVACCRPCHDRIHAGRIFLFGDAEQRVRIERNDR